MENQMKRLVAMVVPDLLVLRGQFVVFVDVQRVPRIVDPPVFNGDAAEIRDAFGNLANFGFDFFMQYCHADSAEIFFQQFVQAEFHGNAAVVHFVNNQYVFCLSVHRERDRAIGLFSLPRSLDLRDRCRSRLW